MNFDWTVFDLAVVVMVVLGIVLWEREVFGKIKINFMYNYLKKKNILENCFKGFCVICNILLYIVFINWEL